MTAGSVAWVFPGQGSQEPGMGRDLYDRFPTARALYEQADAVLERSISSLCFDGSEEELKKTSNAQPAIFVTSYACLAVAREQGLLDDAPAFVAGHSLGEYTALCAADGLEFEDALRLVDARGRLTQEAADATPGGMAAILGLDEGQTQEVCDEAGAELCNINAPGQLVIGGTHEALDRACALALERGARRAIKLDVGGAFHTSLMEPAVAGMERFLSGVKLGAPRVPFVANATGAAMTDPEEVRGELLYQLTHPVRWVQCVEYMASEGVETFVEIGPGRVLSGLNKRIVPAATTRNVSGAGSLVS